MCASVRARPAGADAVVCATVPPVQGSCGGGLNMWLKEALARSSIAPNAAPRDPGISPTPLAPVQLARLAASMSLSQALSGVSGMQEPLRRSGGSVPPVDTRPTPGIVSIGGDASGIAWPDVRAP